MNGNPLKQTHLHPAGCQTWHRNVLACQGERALYCSTLAVYALRTSTGRVEKVLPCHERTITCLTTHPTKPNVIATCALDKMVFQWDVEEEKELRGCQVPAIPLQLAWCPQDAATLAILLEFGDVMMWTQTESGMSNLTKADRLSGGISSLKWAPQSKQGRLALGTVEGEIMLWTPGMKKPEKIAREEKRSKVVELCWDPLSSIYLLVAFEDGSMCLVDTEKRSIALEFETQSYGVAAMSFVQSAPGTFVTANKTSPVLYFWNVSQRSPLESVRLPRKQCGISALASSDSEQALLVSFRDGAVALFSIAKRQYQFCTAASHSETVFDCRFKPQDASILATASHDSTIKLWNTDTMTCIKELTGQGGVLYCLAWAPGGANETRLACSSSNGEVFIWDTASGTVIQKLKVHDEPSFRLSWNSLDDRKIASTAGDEFCVVFTPEAKVISRLKHPDRVYGVDWSPFDKDMLCTGCHDGQVRVFDLKSPQIPKILSGHRNRVFNTVWSPLLPNVLASGSDDHTVRIWNTASGDSTVLSGHTSNVRGLAWSYEVPYVLLSGSWDGTIRVWDIRSGTCLQVAYEHQADIYGLHSHPAKPFCFVSTSRDTTVRMWSLEDLAKSARLSCLINGGQLQPEFLGEAGQLHPTHEHTVLCGALSKQLAVAPQVKKQHPALQYSRMYDVFSATPGVRDLWQLVQSIVANKPSTSALCPHAFDVRQVARAHALSLEITKGVGRGKRTAMLEEAADTYALLGDLRQYCEIKVSLEQWTEALAVAPGVSLEYWRALSKQYAEYLAEKRSRAFVPHLLAAGEAKHVVEVLMIENDEDSAMLVAASAAAGKVSRLHTTEAKQEQPRTTDRHREEFAITPELSSVARAKAERFYSESLPVMAACALLSINDAEGAIKYLCDGDEIELAYALSRALNVPLPADALLLLARSCEQQCLVVEALQLYQELPERSWHGLLLATRLPEKSQERKLVAERACLLAPAAYRLQAEGLEARKEPLPNVIVAYIGAGEYEKAATLGLTFLRSAVTNAGNGLSDIQTVLYILQSIDLHKLLPETKLSLLTYSAYVASLRAMQSSYYPIVPKLTNITSRWIRNGAAFPLSVPSVLLQAATQLAPRDPASAQQVLRDLMVVDKLPAEVKEAAAKLNKSITENTVAPAGSEGESRVIVPTGSRLPSGRRKKVLVISAVTGKPIQGARYVLDDGEACISRAEAVMWARVMPFSPLGAEARFALP